MLRNIFVKEFYSQSKYGFAEELGYTYQIKNNHLLEVIYLIENVLIKISSLWKSFIVWFVGMGGLQLLWAPRMRLD